MFEEFGEGFPAESEEPDAPRFEIVTPKPGVQVRVTLLGDWIVTREKHWDNSVRRPIPCSGKPESCRYCLAGLATIPTGFTAAINQRGRKRVVFQMSAACLKELRRFKVTVASLRGHCFLSERADSRGNSKQTLESWGLDPNDKLPDPFDVRPTLAAMWGQAEARRARGENLTTLAEKRTDRQRKER